MRKLKLEKYRKAGVSIIALIAMISFTIAIQPITADDPPRSIIWDAKLDITAGIDGKSDNVYFGEADDATDGEPPDGHDQPNQIPPPQPYIDAWFDDGMTTSPYEQLSRDYRHYPDVEKIWNLSILYFNMSFPTSTPVNITWNIPQVYASEYDSMVLTDDSFNVLANMFTTNYYSYTSPNLSPQVFHIKAMADTESPQITDQSPDSGETGDTYTFNATVTDNAGVGIVKANWVHDTLSQNTTLANIPGTDFYEATITLDESTNDLMYHLYAEDTAKTPNTNYTPQYSATIIDDEYPTPISDDTTSNPTTGDSITFGLTVTDNIDINYVYANYRWNQDGSWSGWITDEPMSEGSSDDWITTGLIAPLDATDVEYYFEVNDNLHKHS
jgi:hypothetical protein